MATVKGHIRQERQNLQITKPNSGLKHETSQEQSNKSSSSPNIQHFDDDCFPGSESPNKRTNSVIYSIIENSKKGFGYLDLAGKFPFISARGNHYILGAYN